MRRVRIGGGMGVPSYPGELSMCADRYAALTSRLFARRGVEISAWRAARMIQREAPRRLVPCPEISAAIGGARQTPPLRHSRMIGGDRVVLAELRAVIGESRVSGIHDSRFIFVYRVALPPKCGSA